MRDIVLYLHMHQPYRVRPYTIFDIGEKHDYFASYDAMTDNQAIFQKVAHKSYHPMLSLLKRLVDEVDGFSVNLSVPVFSLSSANSGTHLFCTRYGHWLTLAKSNLRPKHTITRSLFSTAARSLKLR